MVGMNLDGGRAQHEIRLEILDQRGERGAQDLRAGGELAVGQLAEPRGLQPEPLGRERRLLATLAPVGGRLGALDTLLPRPVGGDPDPDRLGFPGVQGERASRPQDLVVGMRRKNENPRADELARLVGDQRGLIHRSSSLSASCTFAAV